MGVLGRPILVATDSEPLGLSPVARRTFSHLSAWTPAILAGLTFLRQAGLPRCVSRDRPVDPRCFIENAQQYVPSSVVFPGTSGFFASQFDNGSSATNAGSATLNPAIPNLHPDIVKTAFDWKPACRLFHLESRARFVASRISTISSRRTTTDSVTSRFRSGQRELRVLKHFSLIANTFYGEGGGRFIGGLGPELVVRPEGTLSPCHSGAGSVDLNGKSSAVFDRRLLQRCVLCAQLRFPRVECQVCPKLRWCFRIYLRRFGFPGSANTNNRAIQEGTFGFTQMLWGGRFREAEFITQSSYFVRSPWSVAAGSEKRPRVP